MFKSFRIILMALSAIAFTLGVLAPNFAQASESDKRTPPVIVEWQGTQQDFDALLADLEDLKPQVNKDSTASAYAGQPASASWTSETVSPKELSAWVHGQGSNMMAECREIIIRGTITTPWGPVGVDITILIC